MAWYHNAIFYELYPRAFMDGNNDGYGDFVGLRDKLDYLQWLGVDCLWITPVFPSPLRDDGYDIASFYSIDKMYGMMEDFILTIKAIKDRGMKVVLDLVLNHTSDQHPWFMDARKSKDSPFRDYYVWSDTPDKYADTRIIFVDTEESNWAYAEMTGQYYWHRFYSHQPDLNYDNPKVHEEMLNIARFWLNFGVDGFRVDAVPYLYEREGTNCENLPETHEFVKKLRKMVDEEYPGALLLAEANQWAKDLLPYFGDDDEFQMCFHFPVMPRLYMALAKADRTSVVEILKDTPPIPKNAQWATFLRNHDELTLEMVTPEEREFMWDFYSKDVRQRMNLGIRRRLAPLMNNDRRRIELLHSLLLTLPGAPVLYYGDEIGMGDNISLFDRNGVRTPMQWTSEENGGFSRAPIENLYAPPIMDPDFGFSSVNVESQQADPTSLLNTIRNMLHTRKGISCMAEGTLTWLEDLPVSVMCFWREDEHGKILALHNLADAPITVPLPTGTFGNVLNTDTYLGEISMQPYGYYWLKVQS
jgi:maltose alpha-D-glucosyltransferase/alpha-amylase